ncbi:MAG: TIGR02996 domain-containing protein [Gemmataceae bacterium]
MDGTGQTLTAAVIASPDDDLPRLVYADWCDENGHPERAEFIRVQCALARPDGLPADRLADLRIREQTLLEVHGESWLAPLRARGEPLFSPRTHGRFHRGFVETVWMPAAEFLTNADRLFERCPVRELRVTQTTPEEFRQLVIDGRVFRRLDTLDLSERQLAGLVGPLLQMGATRWPRWNLRRLRLRACGINNAGGYSISRVPRSTFDPVELDVSLNTLDGYGLADLRDRYGPAVRFD